MFCHLLLAVYRLLSIICDRNRLISTITQPFDRQYFAASLAGCKTETRRVIFRHRGDKTIRRDMVQAINYFTACIKKSGDFAAVICKSGLSQSVSLSQFNFQNPISHLLSFVSRYEGIDRSTYYESTIFHSP